MPSTASTTSALATSSTNCRRHSRIRRGSLQRQAWLIAESDLEDVRIINPRSEGGYALDAQWHDDFHHALYALLTGQREGFLMDFGAIADLSKSIAEGFVFDWKYSRYRRRHFGSSSKDRPGEQFVGFIQNHDQIANTSRGKRLSSLVSAGQQKLAAVLTLCSPFLPLLFMGEEYGETAPFLYFTSFDDPGLAAAVREGRKKEMGSHYSESEFADPQAPGTFERCKLDWSKTAISPHAEMLRLYRDLISLRKQHPSLANCRKDLTEVQFDEQAKWLVMKRSDPSGSGALLALISPLRRRAFRLWTASHSWRLALWTGDAIYGGGNGSRPVEHPGSSLATCHWRDLKLPSLYVDTGRNDAVELVADAVVSSGSPCPKSVEGRARSAMACDKFEKRAK